MGGSPTAYFTNADPLPDALPYQALLDMAVRGEVIRTEGFKDFMAADLHWIEPVEYGEEFERLANMDDHPGKPWMPGDTLAAPEADYTCSCAYCSPPPPAEALQAEPLEPQLPWPVVAALATLCVAGIIWSATR